MNLISNTKFGLSIVKNTEKGRYADFRANYDSFLSQPIKLGMFVPCDDDGNVLTKPSFECDCRSVFDTEMCGNYFECEEYNKAKEKVLFEGFGYKQKSGYASVSFNGIEIFWYNNTCNVGENPWNKTEEFNLIEDLLSIRYGLTLTETAKKQIGCQ